MALAQRRFEGHELAIVRYVVVQNASTRVTAVSSRPKGAHGLLRAGTGTGARYRREGWEIFRGKESPCRSDTVAVVPMMAWANVLSNNSFGRSTFYDALPLGYRGTDEVTTTFFPIFTDDASSDPGLAGQWMERESLFLLICPLLFLICVYGAGGRTPPAAEATAREGRNQRGELLIAEA